MRQVNTEVGRKVQGSSNKTQLIKEGNGEMGGFLGKGEGDKHKQWRELGKIATWMAERGHPVIDLPSHPPQKRYKNCASLTPQN